MLFVFNIMFCVAINSSSQNPDFTTIVLTDYVLISVKKHFAHKYQVVHDKSINEPSRTLDRGKYFPDYHFFPKYGRTRCSYKYKPFSTNGSIALDINTFFEEYTFIHFSFRLHLIYFHSY